MTQISLSQLAAHLAKGLRPLYTLHGDEALLQQEALDAIRAAARARRMKGGTISIMIPSMISLSIGVI